MFSNGTEYQNFSSAFCERCKKYEKLSICPIEWQISKTSITGNEKDFPYEHLKPLDNSCRYACKSFESNDKHLMEQYKNLMSE